MNSHEHRNLFTYMDTVQIVKGKHSSMWVFGCNGSSKTLPASKPLMGVSLSPICSTSFKARHLRLQVEDLAMWLVPGNWKQPFMLRTP